MAKQHGTDATGTPVDLIGQPMVAGRGSVPGLQFEEVREGYMPTDRTYERYHYRGSVIRVFVGDTAPAGAVKVEDTRAKQSAPENKAKQAAPQTKSKDA